MNSKTIHQSIHRNIKIEKLDDRVNYYIPFFPNGDKLKITFKLEDEKRDPKYVHGYIAKGGTVLESSGPTFAISDNGMSLDYLRSKVGSLDKYMDRVTNICKFNGFSIVSGRIIKNIYEGESCYDHDYYLSLLLECVSLIVNLDLFISED